MKPLNALTAGLLSFSLLASSSAPADDPPAEQAPAPSPSQEQRRSGLPSDAERIAALEAQVMLLTRALNDARTRIAHLEGGVAPSPIPPLTTIGPDRPVAPEQGGPDPRLQGLIRQLLQEDIDAERAQNLTQEMIDWAEDDRDRQRDLIGFARRATAARIGTQAAQEAIRDLLNRLTEDDSGQHP